MDVRIGHRLAPGSANCRSVSWRGAQRSETIPLLKGADRVAPHYNVRISVSKSWGFPCAIKTAEPRTGAPNEDEARAYLHIVAAEQEGSLSCNR